MAEYLENLWKNNPSKKQIYNPIFILNNFTFLFFYWKLAVVIAYDFMRT